MVLAHVIREVSLLPLKWRPKPWHWLMRLMRFESWHARAQGLIQHLQYLIHRHALGGCLWTLCSFELDRRFVQVNDVNCLIGSICR